MEKESIILAFVGAAVCTLIAANLIKHQLRVTIAFGILVVFAVFYYENVLSSGAVELYQILLALICYTYLFAAVLYLVTLLEQKVFGFCDGPHSPSASISR